MICGYVCKEKKKSTQFVRLVLTRVPVTNFFNIADLDLIFLNNTHILSVCLFVGLFAILFCLSCLSVCMSVLCTVQYCWYVYRMCEYWSFCTSVCFSACTSTLHCPSVCLFVCVCLYVFISVCL